MRLPHPVESEIEKIVGNRIQSFSSVSGGCINNGASFSAGENNFFIKWNDARKFPGMFEDEGNGLDLLRSADTIRVPEVVAAGVSEDYQFLLLEFIRSSRATKRTWENFGEQLAGVHRISSKKFGLDHSNYIGSLQQSNQSALSWTDFFIQQRLQKQLDLAIRNKVADPGLQKKFDAIYRILPGLVNDERPSLLHGDLWGGNVMVDSDSNPVLIDPAVYFGNREVDLAMTQLFGGFDNAYLEAYTGAFPLISGFEERFRVYNLYPLLVHVNLFGRSYLGQVLSTLDYFV